MPLEAIPPALVNGVGVVGLVVILFWMLATGRLVTRREAEDIRADRDVWRSNSLEQKGLMTQMLTGQETTNRLLRSIPHVGDDE
ncbi:hypothetical protein [Nocardioides terrigena]|uniref:hypothetical protein n=1 Tax=Nocardioides terrigena TaxID=424797 RepID=UPI000D322E22|nr:hypothetical protein [Nocardioides terrigena]